MLEAAHVDFIDLERDSAIRVRALMALAAYSVRNSSNKFNFVDFALAWQCERAPVALALRKVGSSLA